VTVLILPYEFTCACAACRIDYQHDPLGSRISVQHPCGKSKDKDIVLQGTMEGIRARSSVPVWAWRAFKESVSVCSRSSSATMRRCSGKLRFVGKGIAITTPCEIFFIVELGTSPGRAANLVGR